ncbi:hypothetical protein ACFQX7_33925 [Luedemannella flava]
MIDHLTLLDPATTDQVASSGAWASYQPGFLASFGLQITASGTDRYLSLLAGRQLLDAGAPLVLSSTTRPARSTRCRTYAPRSRARCPTAPSSRPSRP